MDFTFDAREREIRERAAEVARQAAPHAHEWDEQNALTDELRSLVRDSGLARLMVPAEFGGEDERVDPLLITLVREQLMAASSAADALFALQGIGSNALAAVGTREQKERWLPRVAEMDALAAVALTEPHTGSDLRNISTSLTSKEGRLRRRRAEVLHLQRPLRRHLHGAGQGGRPALPRAGAQGHARASPSRGPPTSARPTSSAR